MKAIALYKPDSEFSRSVEEFAHDMASRTQFEVELINVDSRQGDSLARLYDIVQYPSVVVIRDDGQLVKSWSGVPLPLVNDVLGYLQQ